MRLTHSHSLSLTLTHSLTHSITHTHSLTHTLTHTHTHSHSHSHAHSHTASDTHSTHKHTHNNTIHAHFPPTSIVFLAIRDKWLIAFGDETPCDGGDWPTMALPTQATLVIFTVLDDHFLDYLQFRENEPCRRNALKCFHEAVGHLEVVAAAVPEATLTSRLRYMNMISELLTKTRPGNPARQAPRPLLKVLEAVEGTVVKVTVHPFRSCLCLVRLSLRFDDPRGLEVPLLKRTPEGLSEVVNGLDRGAERKPVYLDKGSCLKEPSWTSACSSRSR